MDDIILALLPDRQRTVFPFLVRIFCACLATGSVPAIWCQVKVLFTSQPGRSSYTGPRDLRPTSLTSFLLTTMETLVDRYLRDGTLDLMPLHPNQHAYQVGRFVEKALHDLVVKDEVLDQKETALGIFLDTEGAFNYNSFNSTCTAPSRHGVGHTVVPWVKAILEGCLATTTLNESFMSTAVSRGCLQGGMLSPLLWCLVEELRVRLKEGGVYTQSYADDISLLTVKKFPNTLSELMQQALHTVQIWMNCWLIPTTLTLSYLQGKGNFLVSLNLFSLDLLCTILHWPSVFGWSQILG